MRRLLSLSTGFVLLLLLPSSGAACSCPYGRMLCICIGTSLSLQQIGERIMIFLTGSIAAVAVTMFVVGAFMIVLSGAKEEYKERGKNLCIGSVISLAVVLGAYSILRTIDFYLQ